MTEIKFVGFNFLYAGGVIVLSLEKGKAVIQTSDIITALYQENEIKIYIKDIVYVGSMPETKQAVLFFNMLMKIYDNQFKAIDYSGLPIGE